MSKNFASAGITVKKSFTAACRTSSRCGWWRTSAATVRRWLAPLDAIDFVLEAFFGAFGNVRVVFFRRHILGPLLKLSAVVVVLLLQGRENALGDAVHGDLLFRRQAPRFTGGRERHPKSRRRTGIRVHAAQRPDERAPLARRGCRAKRLADLQHTLLGWQR